MENAFVYRIAHDTDEARLTLIGVPDKAGIGAIIFRALAESKIHVDMIVYNKVNASEASVSFMIWKKDIPEAERAAKQVAQQIRAKAIKIDDDMARISIIGRGLHNPSGIVAEMFGVFGDENINIQAITTSETRVSCLVKAEETERAVKLLIQKFSLDQNMKNEIPEKHHEEIDFQIPFDAPIDYTLLNG